MNNKGFATSTIIYMLIIVFSLLIFSTVILSSNENKVESEAVAEAKEILDVYNASKNVQKQTAYRYMTEDGTWSNWTTYTDKADIDHSVSITKIKNQGSLVTEYDLSATDVTLVVEDGVSYLDFNGTTSKGDMIFSDATEVTPHTIYVNFKKDTELNATSSAEQYWVAYSDDATDKWLGFGSIAAGLYNEVFTLGHSDGAPRIGSVEPIEANEEVKLVYVWDSDNSTYSIYINGERNPGKITYSTMHRLDFNELYLGYHPIAVTNFTDIDLYDIAFSSHTITDVEAIEVSAGNIEIDDIVDSSDIEVRYGHQVEYGEYVTSVSEIIAGYIWEFAYTGDYQTFTVPQSGSYQIELWGAGLYGKGGYTRGIINLTEGEKLYVYNGEQSCSWHNATLDQPFNGGGGGNLSSYNSQYASSGSGGTDIRIVSGNWDDFDSLKSRIMVAGGGGARSWYSSYGGDAGGLTGTNGNLTRYSTSYSYPSYTATGGTQTSGGNSSAGFGYGGISQAERLAGGGGGGGYYGGGGGGGEYAGSGSGAGGSSFISGHTGCDAITQTSTVGSITHTGAYDHYSGKVFTETSMLGGIHSGNGYTKITFIETN
jgi:hypothetical protein